MPSTTLFECFERSAKTHTDKLLFERPDDPGLSYRRSMALTRRLSGVLLELGIEKGNRVAVQTDKSAEAVLLYLACQQCGAIYLPLNPAYTDEEIDYFLDDSEPALFVCRPDTRNQHARRATVSLAVETLGTEGDGTLMEHAGNAQPREDAEALVESDPAAILYTSGTTGRSKGAVLTHGNLLSNCTALIDCWRFTADDRLIHALPIFHTHGLFVACNMTIVSGATMYLLPGFDTDTIIDLMVDGTVLMGVPTFYTRLLQSDRLNHEATAAMRLFTAGSAPTTSATHAAFTQRTGHAILERYGMTETNMITSNPYDGERRPGAVGFPLTDVTIRVVDRDTAKPLPDGEIGSIEVAGPNVFSEYWRMPDKTAQEFRDDGYFVTGDIGVIDDDGYLSIVGRDKDMVISGGYNIYPKEVESLLDELPAVSESAVFGVSHPDLGEGVTAVVVADGDARPDPDHILSSLADRIAGYKRPKQVVVIDELPRNVMGKVQKNELRERFADLYQNGEA